MPGNAYTFSCQSLPSQDVCYQIENDSTKSIKDVDYKVALDSIHVTDYEEEVKWDSQKYLFNKIYDNQSIIDSATEFEQFYDSIKQTSILPLKKISEITKSLYFNSGSIKALIAYNDSVIASNLLLLAYNDSLILSGGLTSVQLATIKEVNDSLISEIKNYDLLNKTYYESLYLDRDNKVDSALSYNSNIESTKVYLENEKVINDIYYNTIAKDRLDLISNYGGTLESIAGQCPLSGGPAVYKARTLYSYLNNDVYYNVFEMCNRSSSRHSGNNQNALLNDENSFIYPNPTSETATISFNGSQLKSKAIIENLLGQVVLAITLNERKGEVTFEVANFAPSIYFCKVYGENEKLLNCIKILIQK